MGNEKASTLRGYLTKAEQVVLGIVLVNFVKGESDVERSAKRRAIRELGLDWVSRKLRAIASRTGASLEIQVEEIYNAALERGANVTTALVAVINAALALRDPFVGLRDLDTAVEFEAGRETVTWVINRLKKVQAPNAGDDELLADVEERLQELLAVGKIALPGVAANETLVNA